MSDYDPYLEINRLVDNNAEGEVIAYFQTQGDVDLDRYNQFQRPGNNDPLLEAIQAQTRVMEALLKEVRELSKRMEQPWTPLGSDPKD